MVLFLREQITNCYKLFQEFITLNEDMQLFPTEPEGRGGILVFV